MRQHPTRILTAARSARPTLLACSLLWAACSGGVGDESAGSGAPPGDGPPGAIESSAPSAPLVPEGAGPTGSDPPGGTPSGPASASAGPSGMPAGGPPTAEPDPTAPGSMTASDAAVQCGTLGPGPHVGVTRLRRMTQAQFDNTVRDLLGASGSPASAFALDEYVGPFQSNAIAAITPLLVLQHDEVATALAADAVARMDSIAPCDLGQGEACVREFVGQFGLHAYRRPLTSEEQQEHVALFSIGQAEGGVEAGFELVVATFLQSPHFLYHVDTGASGSASADVTPVTSYELAARLSYFLWNSMPDETLFTLAATDALQDDAVLSEQVQRMLADVKAEDAIPFFHLQLLDLVELGGAHKDPTLFPGFDAQVAEAMLAETAAFTDYVVRSGDGRMSTLFQADFGFPEGALFGIYGVTEPSGFAPGMPVPLPLEQRRGLLTQAAFLTRHAHPNQTSPVHRGLLVRENLLCQPVNPPPPEVDNVPPEPSEATTTRERFANHSLDPSCAVCHQLMDPIGLAFEHYDAIGAYRAQDGLGDVDASGEVVGAQGALSGPFYGAIELSDKLANSDEVAECLANQWFRFALGRMETGNDACTLQGAHERFAASGHDVRKLIEQIATSDAFRHVRYEQGQ